MSAAGPGIDGPPPAVIATLDDGRRIEGFADTPFGSVVDAFVANFRTRGDVGAACSVEIDGTPVVELWGGLADARTGRTWDHHTPAVIFSCTKGVLAILVYRLVEAGRLDLDAPIAAVWPEFAAGGKAAVTLRDAMTHRAGLATLDADLSVDDIVGWQPVVRAIERQPPAHDPAAGHQYHTMTYGWIVGEAIRRVTGRLPGRWLHESVSTPLGLELWIGRPDAEPPVAWMEPPLADEDSADARAVARIVASDPAIERAATMGGAFHFPADAEHVTFNEPVLQRAEIPGANGIGTAAALARLYGACVSDRNGPRLLSAASLDDALEARSAGSQRSGLPDDGTRWGTGFQLASPPSQPMLGPSSFGHAGAGGQLAFGDVDARLGFAWLGNQMGGYGDPRAREVTRALRAALDR